VAIRYHDHIGWNSSKIISRPNSSRSMCSLTPSFYLGSSNCQFFRITFKRIIPDDYYLFSSNGYALAAVWSIAMAADYVTNVNLAIEQFATAVGILCCNMNHIWSTDIFVFAFVLMVVNMYRHMGKVVIKILQGSAVSQTMLGGLAIYPPVANFQAYFFGPPCRS